MSGAPDIPDRGEGGGLKAYRRRYVWIVAVGAAAFAVLLGRLWYLQVLEGAYYYEASKENIVRRVELDPPRGRIFDRNGIGLAKNRPAYDVVLVPRVSRRHDVERELDLLKRHLQLSEERVDELAEEVQDRARDIVVERDVTRAEVAALETDKMRLPGVEVQVDIRRTYPLHESMAHVIGYMGKIGESELERLGPAGYSAGDYVGRKGLEEAFEPVLRGSPGSKRVVVDAQGIPQEESPLLGGSDRRIPPVSGRDLELTLDAELQLIAEESLDGFPSGAVVAVDPTDGSVRALYSKPSFDPNAWSGRLSEHEKMERDNDPFKPMIDKTLRPYFPGSVYKIVGAKAGMVEGVVDPSEEVDCPGYYVFGGRRFRCWKWGGHGDVDMLEALMQSCDVYFYQLAEELGMDRIAEHAYTFGFGEHTGVPHNNESRGRVPTRKWHEENSPNGYQHGFALNAVLGQGNTMATPMQVAMAYAAVANGGKLYYPRVVDAIQTREGRTLFRAEPKVRKRLDVSEEQLDVIRTGLKWAVERESGTAYRAKLEEMKIAGKTGTAQVHSIGRVRVPNREKAYPLRDHAWFAGWAPADDPELVVVVFLEHAGHGGEQAAPAATEIIDRYFGRETNRSVKRKLGRDVGPGEDDERE